jgi:biopolymer transport protein ExbB
MELPTDAFDLIDGAPQVDARLLTIALNHIEASLSPTWKEQEIVASSGAIVNVPVLAAGPVEVAYDPHSKMGGLVIRDIATEPHILDIYSRTDLSELASIQQQGGGYLSFDPTLGNALQLRDSEDSLLTHINKGGVWAMPILFFGALSLIISILKGWQFFRLPKVDDSLIDKINGLIAEYRNEPTKINELKQQLKVTAQNALAAQQKMIQISLSLPVSQQRDDLLVAYLMEYKHILERYMGVVATSAAIAPLLGLLGTVSGMISTFKMMTIFGSGDASTVSGGISEALVTTELGLIVAIPSLLVSALLTRRVKSYSHLLENFAIKLSKIKFSI